MEFKLSTEDNGKVKAVDVTGPGGSDVQGAPCEYLALGFVFQ